MDGLGGRHKPNPRRRKSYGPSRVRRLEGPALVQMLDGMTDILYRLHGIAELLYCSTDELQAASVSGVGRVLWDLHGRLEELMLDAERCAGKRRG